MLLSLAGPTGRIWKSPVHKEQVGLGQDWAPLHPTQAAGGSGTGRFGETTAWLGISTFAHLEAGGLHNPAPWAGAARKSSFPQGAL